MQISLATLRSDNERLGRERDDYKADYLRRHKDVGDMMERAIAAEAERDTLLAQVEKLRSAMKGVRRHLTIVLGYDASSVAVEYIDAALTKEPSASPLGEQ